MSILKKATWTELDVVVDHEANLEVVLRIGTDDLDPIVGESGLFLEFKNLAKFLRAMASLE